MQSSYIQYIPKPLLEDIVSSRCLPILGAGFSRNARTRNGSIPLWNDLGEKFAKLMSNYDYTGNIDSISAFTHLNGKTRLAEYLSNFLYINQTQPGKSHISFVELYFKEIITTNFDFVLEDAFRQGNINFRILMEESQLPLSINADEKLVLKIHGDIHHPHRIIATEEDYDRFVSNYPVLSTYISNLLISKTALFIGYSLDDPDFRQLFQILRSRLGKLQRPAYVILVNPKPHEILRFERRGIQVVSIPGQASHYDNILSSLFLEIKAHWDKTYEERKVIVNEKSESVLSLPKGSTSMMCLVSIPLRLQTYYKSYIYPYLEKYGFSPISTIDVMTADENPFTKISNLIQRAELMIAEPLNEMINYEIFTALRNNLGKKPIILLIKEEEEDLPPHFKKLQFIERPKFPLLPDDKFIHPFESFLKSLSSKLIQTFELEPQRLLNKDEYRAAVISAFVLLESELREMIYSESLQKHPYSLSKLIDSLLVKEIIENDELLKLKIWINIRNLLIHTNKGIKKPEAEEIVLGILELIKKIRNKQMDKK